MPVQSDDTRIIMGITSKERQMEMDENFPRKLTTNIRCSYSDVRAKCMQAEETAKTISRSTFQSLVAACLTGL